MQKKIILSFIGLSIAWSCSWFAVKFQSIDDVSIYASITYRFFLAGLIMLILAYFMRQKLKIPYNSLPYILISSLGNGSFNFVAVYQAVRYIPSGIIAAVFSLSILFGEILTSLYEKRKPCFKTIMNGILGTIGLFLFILPTITLSSDYKSTIKGVLIAIFAPLLASIGGIAMKSGTKKYNIPLMTYIGYTFLLGSIFVAVINILCGNKFSFSFEKSYIISLVYIVLIASCLAFICLYYLTQKIGPAKTGFSSLIYTIGAIWISTYFEDYSWSAINIIGFGLILLSMFREFTRQR